MRGKVYEKARAAISRQIEAANPPLADEVVAARRHALEDAIARTESHYVALESPGADAGTSLESKRTTRRDAPAAPLTPPPAQPSSQPRGAADTERTQADLPRGAPVPPVADAPVSRVDPPTARTLTTPAALKPPARAVEAPSRREPVFSEEQATPPALPAGPPVLPAGIEPRDGPDAVEAPFATNEVKPNDRRTPPRLEAPRILATEPDVGLDEGAIPAADLRAPRQTNGARRAKSTRAGQRRAPVLAAAGVLLFVGAGTAAFLYLDEIRSALGIGGSTVAGTSTPPAEGGAAAPGGTETAAAPPAESPSGAATQPKRRFTQRLLPDGTEVDEGPAPAVANAFDEGTNVAAASPPSAETQANAMSPTPGTGETPAPAATPTPDAPAAAPATETAAVRTPPVGDATTPAVAQKAVFYEERSETEAGTQRGGNVVWSVVNEAPAEGQPPEPAIRAVADIPEENIRLTLTIRRNTDATLPASHVIELMFDTPPNFPGGSVANVQRLALKPTEQARGEPLIGVAGKISDGFFIIALNNLSEAANANIDLLSREQWIDIPIAYATGRRALMSIEKGVPGDRVFKQAIDAWASKT
ncbi:hypothetical protein ASG43_01540 [Aureimonas sp. Leaf454]|uniref:hypothetical protein n=1 Tax=Aureimonas sp. Leaf454 TaxID=1736381 RepID=UPI0006FBC055|nr:hypothetical protein [Aureimonas sp. Leaf454]KQT54321.1 hypothetical protein ASG43_01540 [Aureimonas sp. Leaf454]